MRLCWLQDVVGLRGIILLVCAILMLPILTVLALTNIPPLICTISLGITYSFVAVSLEKKKSNLEMRKIVEDSFVKVLFVCLFVSQASLAVWS